MISIVIPYRDRREHLQAYLENARSLFTSLEPYEIIVVHQRDKQLFNKGALVNAGVRESRAEYVILQDVDTIPRAAVLPLYKKTLGERQIESLYSALKTLGGVVKMRRRAYCAIGGFPNNFWGWGAEDAMLLNRAKHAGYSINNHLNPTQPAKELEPFFTLRSDNHVRAKTNYPTHQRKAHVEWHTLSAQQKREAIARDGTIDSVKYKIVSKTRLRVGVPFSQVLSALHSNSNVEGTGNLLILTVNLAPRQ